MTQATSRIGSAIANAAAKLEAAGAGDLARELVEAHYQRERAVSEREATLTKIAREWQERREAMVSRADVRTAFLEYLIGAASSRGTTPDEELADFEEQIARAEVGS